jgi:hypothetical protein
MWILKLITYLLTELSFSWGAINWAATQELPSFSWNPKVQYRIHKSPPLVPILGHIYPIHTTPSHPISLRSTLILSTHLHLCLSSGLLPSGFRRRSSSCFVTFIFADSNKHWTQTEKCCVDSVYNLMATAPHMTLYYIVLKEVLVVSTGTLRFMQGMTYSSLNENYYPINLKASVIYTCRHHNMIDDTVRMAKLTEGRSRVW